MIRVSKNVYRLFAGITANQYLIAESGRISLIDAGLPGSHRLILYSIQQLGFHPEDLQYIFLTHADPDHAGAAAELKKRTGAGIVISAIEMEGLRTGKMTRQLYSTTFEGWVFNRMLPFFPVAGCTADVICSEGQEFPILGSLRVLASPGHTPGHISFYSEQYHILFSGDSINCRDRNQVVPYQGDSTADKLAARRSFERQMALHPHLICGGHSFCRMQP